MNNTILMGEIVKPQGIKGEVKVNVYTNNINRFLLYTEFLINDKLVKVLSKRSDGKAVYLAIDGVYDRNIAETMRGAKLYVYESQLKKLPSDEIYIKDLINSDVFLTDGSFVGKLIDINTNYRQDVFFVQKNEDKPISFPNVRSIIEDFNIAEKKLVIKAEIFAEVAVFED